MPHRYSRPVIVAALAASAASLVTTVATPARAGDDRLIRRCTAEGPGDISMAARYEERRARKKFTIEMEAAPNRAFQAGQRIVFVVAGKVVGSDRLQRVVGGDLVGELNYDTQAGPNDPDEDPFPPGFPPVNNGTRVQVKSGASVVLGCALR